MHAAPYERHLQVEGTSGTPLVFEIPAPISGVLNRLVVKQTSGALAGFTVDIYTSEAPSGDDTDDYSEVEDDTGDAAAFQVLPTQTVNAAASTLALYEKNYGYVVNELAGEGRRKSSLFVKITIAGTGVKEFDFSYLIFGTNPY